jgi:hypothetical protein
MQFVKESTSESYYFSSVVKLITDIRIVFYFLFLVDL